MSKQKRILVVAYYYWPDNSIGAVRPTKIIKYLSSEYAIDVLTRKREDKSVYNGQYASRIFEVEQKQSRASEIIIKFRNTAFYQFFRKKDLSNETKKSNVRGIQNNGKDNSVSLLRKASTKLLMLQSFLDDVRYGKEVVRQIKKLGLSEKYDVIISECAPFSSNIIAYHIAKNIPAVNWIADFRDQVIQTYTPGLMRAFYWHWMKKIEKKACHIVTVNEFCLAGLKLKTNKGKCISNGYDISDFIDESDYNIQKESNSKLTFTYTGNLYPKKSDLSLFFQALRDLSNDGMLDLSKIEVKYAGADYESFYAQAQTYNVEGCLCNAGSLNRMDAINLQEKSDVLLLATWNTDKEQGIITGKFFEYLAARRPIISTVTGNVPNSMIKEYIYEHGLGCCIEHTNIAKEYNSLKQYIKKIYEQFSMSGKVNYTAEEEFINSFSYDELIKKWKTLLN